MMFAALVCVLMGVRGRGACRHTPIAPPNLVLIVADDLGYADVGFNGCRTSRRLGSIGSPRKGCGSRGVCDGAVCGPSRAGLITGRYQDRFGCGNNPTVNPAVPNGVPTSERMISELLRPAGTSRRRSASGTSGPTPGCTRRDRGFDEFYGFLTGGHNYFPENLTLEDLSEVTREVGVVPHQAAGQRQAGRDDKVPDRRAERPAVEFIDRDGKNPFFLYLCYNAPHTPMQATEEYLAQVRGHQGSAPTHLRRDGQRDGRRRSGACSTRSTSAGSPITPLSCSSPTTAARRTTPRATRRCAGTRASPFEGGIRVPFALRWPGVAEPVPAYEFPDQFARYRRDDRRGRRARGEGPGPRDAPARRGGSPPVPHGRGDRPGRTTLLFWRWHDRDEGVVRLGDRKLIARPDAAGGSLLFNIVEDTGERRNLLRHDTAASPETDPGPLESLLAAWYRELIPPAHPGLGSWTFGAE
jgi:hypothetical protein